MAVCFEHAVHRRRRLDESRPSGWNRDFVDARVHGSGVQPAIAREEGLREQVGSQNTFQFRVADDGDAQGCASV
jgi:hypothetical protein